MSYLNRPGTDIEDMQTHVKHIAGGCHIDRQWPVRNVKSNRKVVLFKRRLYLKGPDTQIFRGNRFQTV